MDIYFIFKAVVIAIVEGITEFLPVSSTGHMIIVGDLIGFPETEFTKMFNVVIQLGAILAIVVLYFNKLMGLLISLLRGERRGIAFTKALIIGVIPAGILGVLFEDIIDKYLFKPIPVIIGLFVGAVLLIIVENRFRRKAKTHEVEDITPMQALKVGLVPVPCHVAGNVKVIFHHNGWMDIGAFILCCGRILVLPGDPDNAWSIAPEACEVPDGVRAWQPRVNRACILRAWICGCIHCGSHLRQGLRGICEEKADEGLCSLQDRAFHSPSAACCIQCCFFLGFPGIS